MGDPLAAGAAWVQARVLFTVRWATTLEWVALTVGGTPRIFISKAGAVGGTVFAQWVFTAGTSRVLSGKAAAVSRTKDVERVN